MVAELLAALRARGMTVTSDCGELVLRGEVLPPELVDRIRAASPVLLRIVEEEMFSPYGLGRCRQCGRIQVVERNLVVEGAGRYLCQARRDCLQFVRTTRGRDGTEPSGRPGAAGRELALDVAASTG